ncbi:MAG: DUF748 domain-containing protein [Saprospiraceae bacterium]|nr:DUF748 domain-containing protein [Saprospiraceae bacterium]
MNSKNKPMETTASKSKGRKRLRIKKILLGLLVVLIVIRILLPYIVLKVVNNKLAELDGYTGHVRDIDLALIVGSYKIKDIKLEKTGGKIPVPFFAAEVIDLSVEWKALFKGGLVGEIEVRRPILNFVKGPTEETSQTKIDKEWQDIVNELMPLKLNRFEIVEGEIHYLDYYSSPKVDVFTSNIYILAENLSNVTDSTNLLPSTVTGSAEIYGGKAKLNMKLDALNKTPTFDMNAEMIGLNLVEVNDFLKAYGKFDVQKGTFGVYTEAAAKEGKIIGYTKPIITDLDVIEWKEEKNDPLGQKLLESVVGLGGWIFKNRSEDQVATEIEFEGELKDPAINVWNIIGETLRNAFIEALYPSLEHTININTVKEAEVEKKGFIEKIFDRKDKKKTD